MILVENNNAILHNTKLIRPLYVTFISAIIIGLGTIVYGTEYAFYLIALSVFLINVFCSFERNGSKILAALLLIIAYTFMAATNNSNGNNGDYLVYNDLYNHFFYGGSIANTIGYSAEYGYMLLMLTVSKLNISYNLFMALLAAISIKLIHSTISKLTTNYNLVLTCYALSPFFYDAFQFRYFFAYSIVVYALQFILIERKTSFIRYTALIILASLFHKTIIFFLLYLVLKLSLKPLIKAGIVISLILTAGSFVAKINIIDIVYSFIKFSKFESYTSGSIAYKLNSLVSFAIILLAIYFVVLARMIHKKNPSHTNKQILLLNYLNLIILPFLLVSLDFERLFRPLLLINYAVIATEAKLFRKRNLLIIGLIGVLLARQVLMFDGVSTTILENNFAVEYLTNLFK